ncbi:ceramide synthase 1-like protein, partial [Dinothrombium tinctorium]
MTTNSVWELSPTFTQLYYGTKKFVFDNVQYLRVNYTFPDEFFADIRRCYNNLDDYVLTLIILLAIGWTVIRSVLTTRVFKPIAAYYKLPKDESEKLPESAWKCLFYTLSWMYVARIILLKPECQYFFRPSLVWKDYSMSATIPLDVYIIYVIQLSFYIHSVYATLFVDQWRKDSLVLIGHHIITSVMLLFSLSTRFIARLYWFPLRSLYMTSVYLHENRIQVPFTFAINCLLYILLSMNVYWFTFILNLLYKVISGQIPLEDVRDFDEEQRSDQENGKVCIENDANGEIMEGKQKQNPSRYFLRQRKDVSISRS